MITDTTAIIQIIRCCFKLAADHFSTNSYRDETESSRKRRLLGSIAHEACIAVSWIVIIPLCFDNQKREAGAFAVLEM
jgi:hypothetical protein